VFFPGTQWASDSQSGSKFADSKKIGAGFSGKGAGRSPVGSNWSPKRACFRSSQIDPPLPPGTGLGSCPTGRAPAPAGVSVSPTTEPFSPGKVPWGCRGGQSPRGRHPRSGRTARSLLGPDPELAGDERRCWNPEEPYDRLAELCLHLLGRITHLPSVLQFPAEIEQGPERILGCAAACKIPVPPRKRVPALGVRAC